VRQLTPLRCVTKSQVALWWHEFYRTIVQNLGGDGCNTHHFLHYFLEKGLLMEKGHIHAALPLLLTNFAKVAVTMKTQSPRSIVFTQ
jgi:hypothetical protein